MLAELEEMADSNPEGTIYLAGFERNGTRWNWILANNLKSQEDCDTGLMTTLMMPESEMGKI